MFGNSFFKKITWSRGILFLSFVMASVFLFAGQAHAFQQKVTPLDGLSGDKFGKKWLCMVIMPWLHHLMLMIMVVIRGLLMSIIGMEVFGLSFKN